MRYCVPPPQEAEQALHAPQELGSLTIQLRAVPQALYCTPHPQEVEQACQAFASQGDSHQQFVWHSVCLEDQGWSVLQSFPVGRPTFPVAQFPQHPP